MIPLQIHACCPFFLSFFPENLSLNAPRARVETCLTPAALGLRRSTNPTEAFAPPKTDGSALPYKNRIKHRNHAWFTAISEKIVPGKCTCRC